LDCRFGALKVCDLRSQLLVRRSQLDRTRLHPPVGRIAGGEDLFVLLLQFVFGHPQRFKESRQKLKEAAFGELNKRNK
jgi:hypothetical protein